MLSVAPYGVRVNRIGAPETGHATVRLTLGAGGSDQAGPFETLSVADTGVGPADAGEAGSKTEVLALGSPPARGDARKIEGDANAAQAIVDFLAEKRLI